MFENAPAGLVCVGRIAVVRLRERLLAGQQCPELFQPLCFAGATHYRFERLPSQQSVVQDQLEAMADPALHGAGLRRDDANARYTVQISVRLQRILSPWAWDDWGWGGWDGWGWGGWGWGWSDGFRHRYAFAHFNAFGRIESPWEHREVSVIVRELESNRVVFESHAVNEGPWLDNSSVFPAMFQAALQGFPNPPAGPRQVNIQLGG